MGIRGREEGSGRGWEGGLRGVSGGRGTPPLRPLTCVAICGNAPANGRTRGHFRLSSPCLPPS